jgi:hypothetical protein
MFYPLNHNHDTKESSMRHSFAVSLCAFSTHYNIQSVTLTQQNSQPRRRAHATSSLTFGIENACTVHGECGTPQCHYTTRQSNTML